MKLITGSLVCCHRLAVTAGGNNGLSGSTLVDGRYTYQEVFFTDLVVHKVFYKIRIFFSLVFTISCELYSEKARLHLKQMTVYAVYSTTNVMIETQ